jgi:hypothetical protein
MPRATLGSSDLRSQVAIFGEWNIYGTRKNKSVVKFQTSNAYLRKRSADLKTTTKKPNRVGRLHFVHDVTLFCRSFTSVRLVCFVSHSNDMTSWLSNLAENVSCNVVTSCLQWRHRWMRFYTKLTNRTLALERWFEKPKNRLFGEIRLFGHVRLNK